MNLMIYMKYTKTELLNIGHKYLVSKKMITHRTYTFAKRYIQSCNIKHESCFMLDDIPFDHIYNSNTLVDTNTANFKFEKYGMHKRNIAKYNGFQYVCIYPWDNYEKVISCYLSPLIKIYARQCRIFKLHESVGKKFIDQYDIYGNCRGQVLFLGLVYQGDIVQVMSFKKASTRSHHDVQISRICTKSRYQVVGGVSKLLHFAAHGFDLYNIIVYNDLSKFSGDVFQKIGMKLDHINPPQLIWYKESKNKYIADSMRYMYHKTKEDMIHESYLPIYNCGTSVYVL